MKILQVISGRDVNGALVYCKLLSEILASRGHEVSILCRPTSWMLDQDYKADIQLIESPLTRLPFSELRRIASWIKDNKIDLIHTHMTRGHSFGVLLRMLTGVPVVATAHSRHFQLHWNFNNFVIANSNATRDFHRRVNRIPDSRIKTVHCCTNLERFEQVTRRDVRVVRRQLRYTGDEILMGVVGEVLIRKGHQYLFEALPRIFKAVPNLRLVVLGRFHRDEPYTKRLRQILIEHQLYRKTKWLGRRENVEHFMAAFDFTVVPSIEEPLGLVAIESLAAATPVVATDTGGLPEIIEDGVNGILVPPRDSDALANSVIRMATDEALRRQLGKAGQKFVTRTFAPEKLVTDVEAVYSQMTSTRRSMAA